MIWATRVNGLSLRDFASTGDKVAVMMRPEHLELTRTATPDSLLRAAGSDMTFLGNHVAVELRTAWGETVTVRLSFGHPLGITLTFGDSVFIARKSNETSLTATDHRV